MLSAKFFSMVRASIFKGVMSQTEVDCLNAIENSYCNVYRYNKNSPINCLAYLMATAWHEARLEWDIREVGRGKGKSYGNVDSVTGFAYYGRGLAQLTWKVNYASMGEHLGVNLVFNPDLMLEKTNSVDTLVYGAMTGAFTRKGLLTIEKYGDVNSAKGIQTMFYNMREAINGNDKASLIAGYACDFACALLADQVATPTVAKPAATPVVKPEPETKETKPMGKLMMSASFMGTLLSAVETYGPVVAEDAYSAVENRDKIVDTATDLGKKIKTLDLANAQLDANAILGFCGLSWGSLSNIITHAINNAPPAK